MKRKIVCFMSVLVILIMAAGCRRSDGTSAGSPTRTSGMETTAPGAGATETAASKDGAAGTGTAAPGAGADGRETAGITETETTVSSAGEKTGAKTGTESSTSASRISEEKAKEIALKKVPQAAEENIRIHLDYENGKPVYEGSIVYDGIEYDFEIDAATGTILEWEEER
ncbi:MAG: PepSY domain-containing protein [Lachnospiraceae bacterium]|nr:PepSY domain-containing protein [Lachnospiraceae bacterium]